MQIRGIEQGIVRNTVVYEQTKLTVDSMEIYCLLSIWSSQANYLALKFGLMKILDQFTKNPENQSLWTTIL